MSGGDFTSDGAHGRFGRLRQRISELAARLMPTNW
jgi:hypothetical protein